MTTLTSMLLRDHFSSTIHSKLANNLPSDEQRLRKRGWASGLGGWGAGGSFFITIKHQVISAFTGNMAKEQ